MLLDPIIGMARRKIPRIEGERQMHHLFKQFVGLVGVAVVTASSATGSIDTTSSWNGTTNAGPFGESDTATFGQSISTDAAGGLLKSFTFYLAPLDLDLRAYVYEWDGIKAVGTALFAGSTFNIGDAFSGYKPVTVDTLGVSLRANKQYVLLLTSSGIQASKFNTNAWGALKTNPYAGGEFVFHNSGNDFSSLKADAGWDCGDGCGFMGNGADLAFKAMIDPAPTLVPEPGTYALLLGGLGFLSLAARRRRL